MAMQRANPDTLLSRPTEANNQDKVSMGQNAALNAAEVMTLLQEVLASLLVALSNAASLRNEEDFSASGQALLLHIRLFSPVLTSDRRLDHDLRQLTKAIDAGGLPGGRSDETVLKEN
jgi:histidine ammonia-lyase